MKERLFAAARPLSKSTSCRRRSPTFVFVCKPTAAPRAWSALIALASVAFIILCVPSPGPPIQRLKQSAPRARAAAAQAWAPPPRPPRLAFLLRSPLMKRSPPPPSPPPPPRTALVVVVHVDKRRAAAVKNPTTQLALFDILLISSPLLAGGFVPGLQRVGVLCKPQRVRSTWGLETRAGST